MMMSLEVIVDWELGRGVRREIARSAIGKKLKIRPERCFALPLRMMKLLIDSYI